MQARKELFPVETAGWSLGMLRWKSEAYLVEQDEANDEEIGLGRVKGVWRKGRDSLQTPGIR